MDVFETIVVAKDFSEAPGARFRQDGPFSGEEFYERLLVPKFRAAVTANGALLVDLDGTWGYASSFISGSFGQLARTFGKEALERHLSLKSDEDSFLIGTIWQEVEAESAHWTPQDAR